MTDEDEGRPMTALDDLAYDVSDLTATIRLMGSQQSRIEIKLDAVLECFRILGQALEEAGSRVPMVRRICRIVSINSWRTNDPADIG